MLLRISSRYLMAGLLLAAVAITAVAAAPGPKTIPMASFKDADIRDVLNLLADRAGVTVTMDGTVTGLVTCHFEEMTFDDCLDYLAEQYDFFVIRNDNVYAVTKRLVRVTADGEGRFSCEFSSAGLDEALAELTRAAGVSVTLLGQQPGGSVDLVVTGLPLADIVDMLAEKTHCQVERRDTAYILRPLGNIGRDSVSFTDGRLSVDLDAVPLGTLVRELSDKTGETVICEQGAAATQVTVFVSPLPLAEALDAIAAASGLRVTREDGHWYFARAAEAIGGISVRDGRLTLDVRNAEIADVLREIARQAGLTVIPDREVSGRVSGNINGQELLPGLGLFLEANGFSLEQQGAAYYVRRAAPGQSVVISVDEDGLVSLDADNANLAMAITELAKRCGYGLTIYAGANVNRNVTSVHIKGASFEEALDRLIAGTTLTYRLEGETYLIGEGVAPQSGVTDFLESEVVPVRNVPVDTVMSLLPASFPRQNIIQLKDNNSLLITGTPAMIATFKDFLAKVDDPGLKTATEIIPLKNMKAEDALKLLPPGLPATELVPIVETNSISVTGTDEYRRQMREELEKIDVAAPQILFDILVLQVTSNETRGGGLDSLDIQLDGQDIAWDLGGLVGSIISPGSPAALKLTASIKAAVSEGTAQIRANPKIATLSGSQAHFEVVTKYNWSVKTTTDSGQEGSGTPATEYNTFTVNSGITLDLTPWVSAGGEITLDLSPKISQYSLSPKVGGETQALPGTVERASQSTVRIRDGYTVVISGFIQDTDTETVSKLPVLGQIPLLGRIFQSKDSSRQRDEFIIVITPHLVADSEEINGIVGGASGDGSSPEPIVIDLDAEK